MTALPHEGNPWQMGAQYQYGMLWLSGHGVAKQDEEEAVKWLRRAAELGHPEAQYNLGVRNPACLVCACSTRE